MKLFKPFRHKLKVIKTSKEEIELGFEVFERESAKNLQKISFKKPHIRKEVPTDITAHAAQLSKKQRIRYLSGLRKANVISKNQMRLIKRNLQLPKLKNRERYKTQAPKKYADYIISKYWTERRNQYWQTHPRECAACGSKQYIHLHHMVYGKFGHEPDEWLVALCGHHHDSYHAKYGVQGNMTKTTQEYIDWVRAL